MSADEIRGFAAELEDAIAEVLVSKTRKALWDTGAKTFVIGGGVGCQQIYTRKGRGISARRVPRCRVASPQFDITGDNAIMIAQAALARALSGKNDAADSDLRAVGNLSIANK